MKRYRPHHKGWIKIITLLIKCLSFNSSKYLNLSIYVYMYIYIYICFFFSKRCTCRQAESQTVCQLTNQHKSLLHSTWKTLHGWSAWPPTEATARREDDSGCLRKSVCFVSQVTLHVTSVDRASLHWIYTGTAIMISGIRTCIQTEWYQDSFILIYSNWLETSTQVFSMHFYLPASGSTEGWHSHLLPYRNQLSSLRHNFLTPVWSWNFDCNKFPYELLSGKESRDMF